eukprot:CAMPEP_0181304422 /NCGR_PEP_ID=MMETSP1101-20121128/9142_1 /TAXON_ID=46948 /ORGANISM="Rhodomonas abbreviata, Strain Caron Lab Isolate" /LENGTH=914 /DNA_ID=CAMNT_0023410179 /DNA_START=32 /DNA_END=2773 /DNA_ORIENTATION=-
MTSDDAAPSEGQIENKWVPLNMEEVSSNSFSPALSPAASHPLGGGPQKSETPHPAANGQANPVANEGAAPATPTDPLSKASVISDPLSSAAKTPTDPLSAASDPLSAGNQNSTPSKEKNATDDGEAEAALDSELDLKDSRTIIPWSIRKTQIVQTFTTTGTIQMPSFVSNEVAKAGRGGNTLQARVDSIDDGDDEVSMVRYSAREYVQNMTEMNEELARAWNNEERVKALKMAIQCAKLLGDSSTPQFYPSLFVLVTEILDTFGRLVFERIKQKGLTAAGKKKKRMEDFGPDDVTEEARETCKNWFYKIASIRELIPRVYMEMAIIRCYQFLYGYGEFESSLRRLAGMLRGIADPLGSVHARAYLVRRSEDINASLIAPVMDCFQDSSQCLALLHSSYWSNRITSVNKLDVDTYASLLGPALDYQLQCLGHKGGRSCCIEVLKNYAHLCKAGPAGGRVAGTGMLLEFILKNFEAENLSGVVVELVRLINEEVAEGGLDKHVHLYGILGRALVVSPPPAETRLPLLNEIWKHVAACSDVKAYLGVASVFIQYVVKYFGDKEVCLLLGDVVRHVSGAARAESAVQEELQRTTLHIVAHRNSFQGLIALQQWMPVVDLLQGPGLVEVSKAMLRLFTSTSSAQEARDPVAVHAAFGLAKTVHDAIDDLSSDNQRREAGVLICGFLRRIGFGSELEQHLNFLVDSRRFLVSLDIVTHTLAMEAVSLVAVCQEKVKGRHTRRTLSFVKACLAFVIVTLPSVQDREWQLQGLLLGGQVALRAGLIAQAESFFKAIVQAIQDLPSLSPSAQLSDEWLTSYLSSFASTLVAVPGHPEHGPLYVVNGLLTVVRKHAWQGGGAARARAYAPMIALLCAYAQPRLPYQVAGVDGNDVLFARDAAFFSEIHQTLARIVDEALDAALD